MMFRYFWWFIVAMGIVVVPLFWNRNITLLQSVEIGIVPLWLLVQLGKRWNLLSTRRRIVAVSTVGGLVAGVTLGMIVGWNGGPSGSPSVQMFGRQIHVSVIGLPVEFGVGICLFLAFPLGFVWAAMTAYERRSERSVDWLTRPVEDRRSLDRPTALAALGYDQRFARDAAARYFGEEALVHGRRRYEALGPLAIAARRYLNEFYPEGRKPEDPMPLSVSAVAIMKIIGAEKLSLDWSCSFDELKTSLIGTAESDSESVIREDAQKYLSHWEQLSSQERKSGR